MKIRNFVQHTDKFGMGMDPVVSTKGEKIVTRSRSMLFYLYFFIFIGIAVFLLEILKFCCKCYPKKKLFT